MSVAIQISGTTSLIEIIPSCAKAISLAQEKLIYGIANPVNYRPTPNPTAKPAAPPKAAPNAALITAESHAPTAPQARAEPRSLAA
jgi:hypothetical protein